MSIRKDGRYWIYGAHAASAALANPERDVRRVVVVRGGGAPGWERDRHPKVEEVDTRALNNILPHEAVHQGIAVEVEPLQGPGLSDVLQHGQAPLLLLDQVTDPHNVGAILRSAAAFGAAGVVVTKHNAPAESGVLAKAACGALEIVPFLFVTNLTQSFEEIKQAGYWIAGLDGAATQALHEAKLDYAKTALVLGAEGKGLRRLTAERCDLLVKLPISERMESLNVSNAAAVALYELFRSR